VDIIAGFVKLTQTLNSYTYVIDNPLKYVDPMGLMIVNIGGNKNADFKNEITLTQKWLELLGYFKMPENTEYGTYGALTDEAIRKFQFDYGFAVNGNLTDNIFLSLYNVILTSSNYTNLKKESLYNEMKAHLKTTNNRVYGDNNYSTYYPVYRCLYYKAKPFMSYSTEQAGVKVGYKNGKYYYDYTVPINNMLERNLSECYKHKFDTHAEVYEKYTKGLTMFGWFLIGDELDNQIMNIYLSGMIDSMIWFTSVVNNGCEWDIKRESIWKIQLNVPYLGISVNFIYEGELMNAEQLGNLTFGYWGTGIGFNESQLLTGGDFASIISTGKFDDDEDKGWINKGIQKYNKSKK
jgi:hypothetical protein